MTVLSPSFTFAETILECNGTERMDKTDGINVESGKAIKKTILYILNEDSIEIENVKIPFSQQTQTHYYWFFNPKKMTKASLDTISGDLNRVNGKTYIRKTFIDDETIPKYREFVFKGECSETETRF